MRGVLLAGLISSALGLAACGGSDDPGDQSSAIAANIKEKGADRVQEVVTQGLGPGATVNVDDSSCTRSGDTQNYSCEAHFTINAPEANLDAQKYLLNITATCNDTGECQWHAAGDGIPVEG